MIRHRTDRQAVQGGQVEMRWLRCPDCRHIALHTWTILDETRTPEIERRDQHSA